jgi:tryptophanyl-tRNA synthetase
MNDLMDRVKQILEEAGVKHDFTKLPDDISMEVDVHMKFHGKDLRFAMTNMVLKTEKGLVVIQKRGDTSIDNKKLKEFLGVKRLSLASEDDLGKYDLSPGIVPPIGYDLSIYMDRRVLEVDQIYTGTGHRLYTLKLSPHDLVTINKAKLGDFTNLVDTQSSGRVLSGIRATGKLHLGNYLGAVKGFLELQRDPNYQTFYMVVDLHTVTTPYDEKALRDQVRNIVIEYLACGLDPQKSVLFIQSMVPEHIELAYLFSTVMSVARLQHLPTFKEKVKQHPENVTMALLNYPVLMAADILVYKASLVPVGVDQEPHLEIAREIARKMNDQYNLNLPEPERFATKGEYIPSLTGEGKMSKSIEGSYINIDDDLKTIQEKLAKAPTDEGKGKKIPTEGGVAVLLKFVELFQGSEKRKEYEEKYLGDGIRYKDLKEELSEAIYAELKPIQEKKKELEQNPELVDRIIKEGAQKARKVAQETLLEVKKAMGINYDHH